MSTSNPGSPQLQSISLLYLDPRFNNPDLPLLVTVLTFLSSVPSPTQSPGQMRSPSVTGLKPSTIPVLDDPVRLLIRPLNVLSLPSVPEYSWNIRLKPPLWSEWFKPITSPCPARSGTDIPRIPPTQRVVSVVFVLYFFFHSSWPAVTRADPSRTLVMVIALRQALSLPSAAVRRVRVTPRKVVPPTIMEATTAFWAPGGILTPSMATDVVLAKVESVQPSKLAAV